MLAQVTRRNNNVKQVEETDMSDIADRVKKIVIEHLGVDAEKGTESASFIDDLGADSLDIVELAMAMEEEFSIEHLPDDDVETRATVGELCSLVDSLRTSNLK